MLFNPSVSSSAVLIALIVSSAPAQATEPGEVLSHQKISATSGGLAGPLADYDSLGSSVTSLGDLDGDGIADLAVGAEGDAGHGAVWVLFMNSDGTVKAEQRISSGSGGFTGVLADTDAFGCGLATLGDLDGDGVTDLAVGALGTGICNRGAVWVLFMNADGTVKAHQKIGAAEGGFTYPLACNDKFGRALAPLGDLDGDGLPDLAGYARFDGGGSSLAGGFFVLFLNADGTVKAHQKVADGEGGFSGALDGGDLLGWSLGNLGDVDGDGVVDLAAGAVGDDDGGNQAGAVWVLFMNADGTVKTQQKISPGTGGFTGPLVAFDFLGRSATAVGDLDGDGVTELCVGMDASSSRGAVWMLFLDTDGTVKNELKIAEGVGGFTGVLDNGDLFGWAAAGLGDLDGDGFPDLAVSSRSDDDGGNGRGAVWVLSLAGANPWEDLGNALAGTHGEPALVGSGTLEGGTPVALTLTGALENALAYLVLSAARIDAPFHGGILVPDPALTGSIIMHLTDGVGGALNAGTWPIGLPAGFVTFFQYWIVDPGGISGFAASNAVSGTAP